VKRSVLVGSRNRITIPSEAMRAAHLKLGDLMEWRARGTSLVATRVRVKTRNTKRA